MLMPMSVLQELECRVRYGPFLQGRLVASLFLGRLCAFRLRLGMLHLKHQRTQNFQVGLLKVDPPNNKEYSAPMSIPKSGGLAGILRTGLGLQLG